MITTSTFLVGFHLAVGTAAAVFLAAAVPVVGVLITDRARRAAE